jgi:hypothetical protein
MHAPRNWKVKKKNNQTSENLLDGERRLVFFISAPDILSTEHLAAFFNLMEQDVFREKSN